MPFWFMILVLHRIKEGNEVTDIIEGLSNIQTAIPALLMQKNWEGRVFEGVEMACTTLDFRWGSFFNVLLLKKLIYILGGGRLG